MQGSVRGGLDGDVAGCIDLWTQVIAARDGLDATDDVRQRTSAAFQQPTIRFAVTGSRPDGFALTVINEPHIALLSRICVHPLATSQGLGTALLADAVKHARAAGFSQLRLDVRQSNARASALYAREGFAPITGPWHLDHGDPVLTWSLDL